MVKIAELYKKYMIYMYIAYSWTLVTTYMYSLEYQSAVIMYYIILARDVSIVLEQYIKWDKLHLIALWEHY